MTADENTKALSELENDEASDVNTPEETEKTVNEETETKEENEKVSNEDTDTEDDNDEDSKQTHRVRAPIIIAACLVFASIIFFVLWGFFFSQNSKIGIWQYSVSVGEGDNKSVYTYTLSLKITMYADTIWAALHTQVTIHRELHLTEQSHSTLCSQDSDVKLTTITSIIQ